MQSNHTAIGAYSVEHKERYDIIIGEEWYIFVLQVSIEELFTVPSIQYVFVSHTTCYFCDSRMCKV